MIKTNNLTKKFNSLTAVDKLTLAVPKGELYGFIGPNGAGKTTTIKMLVGILPPTTGEASIGGYDIQKNPINAKKLIGYIPDLPYVYPYMTGREFLHFVGALYEVKNIETKVKKLLKIYAVEKLIDGYFKDFSRGTQQKLSILGALLHDPQVLIIDEPVWGLDPESTLVTKKLLTDFSRKGGTVFVSSHTLSVIEEICDRIGVIDKGQLIFTGTILQLKRKAKSKADSLEKLYLRLTHHV